MVSPSGMILFEQFLEEHPSLNFEITIEDVQKFGKKILKIKNKF